MKRNRAKHRAPKFNWPTLTELKPKSYTDGQPLHQTLETPKYGMMTRYFLISILYILNRNHRFGKKRLQDAAEAFREFWVVEEKGNTTLLEELDRWLDKMGVNL